MCHHKLFIFATCGHSVWQPGPLIQCRDASISPVASFSESCRPRSHPYQTVKIHKLCFVCQRRRDILLLEAESRSGEVRFEEWRWRMKYQSPTAEENAWKTWGGANVGGNGGSRIGRIGLGMLKAGLRISGGGS